MNPSQNSPTFHEQKFVKKVVNSTPFLPSAALSKAPVKILISFPKIQIHLLSLLLFGADIAEVCLCYQKHN